MQCISQMSAAYTSKHPFFEIKLSAELDLDENDCETVYCDPSQSHLAQAEGHEMKCKINFMNIQKVPHLVIHGYASSICGKYEQICSQGDNVYFEVDSQCLLCLEMVLKFCQQSRNWPLKIFPDTNFESFICHKPIKMNCKRGKFNNFHWLNMFNKVYKKTSWNQIDITGYATQV